MLSDSRINSIRGSESELAERIQSIYDDVDVVITPGTATGPSRVGAYQRRGAISTMTLVAQRVPFQGIFNVTGQPAAVVPWDLDDNGVPTSIQLVGRPFDESTLLSLPGAQIEARPGPGPTAACRCPDRSERGAKAPHLSTGARNCSRAPTGIGSSPSCGPICRVTVNAAASLPLAPAAGDGALGPLEGSPRQVFPATGDDQLLVP